MGAGLAVFVWVSAGFAAFFALEQFLHWHHCHREDAGWRREPLTYLILIGDGLHNLLGGFAVAGAFIADVRLGIGAWLAAVAHEVPQELGDFAVLLHGGWEKRRALVFNVLSAMTFPLGGILGVRPPRSRSTSPSSCPLPPGISSTSPPPTSCPR